MTTEVRERRLSLTFEDGWAVTKWDEGSEYRDGLQTTNGVKACDVVAVRPDGPRPILVLAEFKDFDDPKISNSRRAAAARKATSATLIEELVHKTLDTLAGATFAHDQEHQRSGVLAAWDRVIRRGSPSILLLFCIEFPGSQEPMILPWSTKLKQRLRYLGPDVHVVVTSRDSVFDRLGIRYAVHGPAASDG